MLRMLNDNDSYFDTGAREARSSETAEPCLLSVRQIIF